MSDRRNKLKRAEAAASIEAMLDGLAERAGEPLVPGVHARKNPFDPAPMDDDDYDDHYYDDWIAAKATASSSKDDYFEYKREEDFGDGEWEAAAAQPWDYVVHWTNYPRITYSIPMRDRETVVVHPSDDPIRAAENLVDAMRNLGLDVMVRVGSSGAYKFIIERAEP